MAGVEVVEKADQLHGGIQSLLFPELQIWSIQKNLTYLQNHLPSSPNYLVTATLHTLGHSP